jgi:hypothetical protein
MLDGTCGCRLCGLRGYSKNVATRSVFPSFRGRPLLLESYEAGITALADATRPGQYLFGSRALDWSKDDTPPISLADHIIRYLQSPDAKPEDLRILLCVHDWVQDEGTATV